MAHHEPSVRLSRITLAAGGSRSQTNRLGGREGRGLRFRGRSGGRGAAVRYCRRQMAASLKLVEWRILFDMLLREGFAQSQSASLKFAYYARHRGSLCAFWLCCLINHNDGRPRSGVGAYSCCQPIHTQPRLLEHKASRTC